jgi:hypothetical protein
MTGVVQLHLNSSLLDLIRQSMSPLSMDHRVKPGGDDKEPAALSAGGANRYDL